MIIIILYTTVCFALIYAVGQIIKVLLERLGSFKIESLNDLVVCGFVSISIIAGYSSLIIPINGNVLLWFALFIATLYFYLMRYEKSFRIGALLSKVKTNRKEAIFFIITLLFLALIASKEIYTSDSGLYHTQSVKWIRTFPVVPGLANFQPQFGFNSMFFPISALFTLDIPTFLKGSDLLVYPLNIILFLTISSKIFSTILLKIQRGNAIDAIFYICLISPMFLLLPMHISSLSSDVACALLLIYLFHMVLEEDFHKKSGNIYFIVLLSSIIISFKLSSISIALLCIGLIFFQKNRIALLYKSAVISLLVFTPFFLRNYYLSGYLVFPFDGIDIFKPDWKVPIEALSFESGVVKAWARSPGKLASLNMSITEWIGPWWNHQDLIDKTLILSNSITIILLIKSIYNRNPKIALTSLVVISNFVFWFFTAPELRFAYGFLFLGFALSCQGFLKLLNLNKLIAKLYLPIIGLSICCVLFFNRATLNLNARDVTSLVIPYSYPNPEVKKVSIDFDYFHAKHPNACFNHDLPCNSRLTNRNYNIYLRSADLSSGFRVTKKVN